jgi:hypothetical protein
MIAFLSPNLYYISRPGTSNYPQKIQRQLRVYQVHQNGAVEAGERHTKRHIPGYVFEFVDQGEGTLKNPGPFRLCGGVDPD